MKVPSCRAMQARCGVRNWLQCLSVHSTRWWRMPITMLRSHAHLSTAQCPVLTYSVCLLTVVLPIPYAKSGTDIAWPARRQPPPRRTTKEEEEETEG